MNIAEILKDAPIGAYTNGIKLYSPMFGDVELMNILDDGQIEVSEKDGTIWRFKSDGCFPYGGEIMLFPSKENRDWSTFKVESKFPTNIADCRSILKSGANKMTHLYELAAKIDSLRQLIITRDAWWKVDNDWKPDWNEESDTWKYVIIRREDEVIVTEECVIARTLAFRTKEIRDKFLETFRDLIEQCKELI